MPKSKSTTSRQPKGWPSEITYLQAPCYSKRFDSNKIAALVIPVSNLPLNEQARKLSGPYANVKITPITEKTHPANGQCGLFASQHLPPDTLILPYLGYVHDEKEIDENSNYDLSLDREHGVGVDATNIGNEARFINDYRGVSVGPNAEFRDIFADLGNGKVEKRMGVFVLSAGKSGKRAKGIAKGEEILVSYGKGFWTERLATQG